MDCRDAMKAVCEHRKYEQNRIYLLGRVGGGWGVEGIRFRKYQFSNAVCVPEVMSEQQTG